MGILENVPTNINSNVCFLLLYYLQLINTLLLTAISITLLLSATESAHCYQLLVAHIAIYS